MLKIVSLAIRCTLPPVLESQIYEIPLDKALAAIPILSPTATAVLCQGLSSDFLSTHLPRILEMPVLNSIQFAQCKVEDVLVSISNGATAYRAITLLSLESTTCSIPQLMTMMKAFSSLTELRLVNISLEYAERKPQAITPHPTLHTLKFSPAVASVGTTPAWSGSMFRQLFPTAKKIDLRDFPAETKNYLIAWIINFGQFIVSGSVILDLGETLYAVETKIPPKKSIVLIDSTPEYEA